MHNPCHANLDPERDRSGRALLLGAGHNLRLNRLHGSGKRAAVEGQCGTTSLVIQDLLGGDLKVADVEYEGRVEGVHYWNVTPDGAEVDLTRDQFVAGESLVNERVVRVGRNSSSAGEQPFQLLRQRVSAALAS